MEEGRAITASSAAVLAQDRATDAWNEYQADSLKRHLYEIAGEEGHDHKADIGQQRTEQDAARKTAQAAEADRDRELAASAEHEERHHWLTGAATLVEIGIALSTVAIITRRRLFCSFAAPSAWAPLSIGAVRGRVSGLEAPATESRGAAFPGSHRAWARDAAPFAGAEGPLDLRLLPGSALFF